MALYRENPKESTKTLVVPINEFSKLVGYKRSIHKSQLPFYSFVRNNLVMKFRKQFYSQEL